MTSSVATRENWSPRLRARGGSWSTGKSWEVSSSSSGTKEEICGSLHATLTSCMLSGCSFHNSIDATEEDGSLGRLINHSRLKPNVFVKIVASDSRPHLCMFAATEIKSGQELLYDYRERSKATLQSKFPTLVRLRIRIAPQNAYTPLFHLQQSCGSSPICSA